MQQIFCYARMVEEVNAPTNVLFMGQLYIYFFMYDIVIVKLKLLIDTPITSVYRSILTLPTRPRFIFSRNKAKLAPAALCIFNFAFGLKVCKYFLTTFPERLEFIQQPKS